MADLVIMDPPQPPAHRLSATCDRHPDENFTGFCTSCLRERLQSLESASTTATTHRNSTSTISSSLKSIFFVKPTTAAAANNNNNNAISSSELRRCKSFACGRGDGFSAPRLSTSFEPQRKSCDIRGRNTLWSLFNQDDNARILSLDGTFSSATAEITSEIEIQAHGGDEIAPAVATDSATVELMPMSCEIASDEKPMKDHIHIDLESQAKKSPPIAGGFWLAASVFSKKLQKWRRKQKLKKMKKQQQQQQDGRNRSSYSSARFRETQSEMAVDAFGRRSLDLDPRFSLDAGRISFEDQRYSFDEPRASWDGYLIGGGRSVLSRPPPMLSVVEDSPAPALLVQRTDGEIPVEEDLFTSGPDAALSRSQRPSLDRSTSKRSSVELNDTKSAVMSSNAKLQLSPAGSSNDLFRDWSSNSPRDDRSESFDSAFREEDSSGKLPPRKKSKRWSKAWSIWGFIHRRSTGSRGGGNVQVDRVSFSEAWPELMRTNGYHANGRIFRSNSSVSSRSSSYGINAGFGSRRRNGVADQSNGIGKKRRDEFVLDRNPSHARFSPGHVDNGMLRFYLTPVRGSRRGSGKAKNSPSYHSFARSVLQLY